MGNAPVVSEGACPDRSLGLCNGQAEVGGNGTDGFETECPGALVIEGTLGNAKGTGHPHVKDQGSGVGEEGVSKGRGLGSPDFSGVEVVGEGRTVWAGHVGTKGLGVEVVKGVADGATNGRAG